LSSTLKPITLSIIIFDDGGEAELMHEPSFSRLSRKHKKLDKRASGLYIEGIWGELIFLFRFFFHPEVGLLMHGEA